MLLRITTLQNNPYFCVFKYARAVKQMVGNEAENSERDWGETLKIRLSRLTRRVRLARKTLTPHFTFFFTDFEKKTRLSCSLKNNRKNYPRKFFWTKGKETRVKFNPGLSVNRPLNHWVHFSSEFISKPVLPIPQRKHSLISLYRMKMAAQPNYRIILWTFTTGTQFGLF